MIPYLVLAFIVGCGLGMLVISVGSISSVTKRVDRAYRAGLIDGREALQRETLAQAFDDNEADAASADAGSGTGQQQGAEPKHVRPTEEKEKSR